MKQFSFYEDYYTFGLYINNLEDIKKYYYFDKLLLAKAQFENLYNNVLVNKKPSIFSDFYNLMKKDDYPELYIFSQFYNMSIAGSTNIAKSFIYLLNFCEEENLSYLLHKNQSTIEEIYSTSGKMLSELYRLLPFINNQIVPPFIVREVIDEFSINENVNIKVGDKIYYYHLLENLSSSLDLPMKFNPFRETNNYKGKSSQIFGAGIHYCCGASLTDLWLHHLLVGYLKSGVNLKSEKGLQQLIYNPDFEEIKKISYMVKTT